MQSKPLLSALFCLSTLITGLRAASSQQEQPLDPEWLQAMYEEGWLKVQEGVLHPPPKASTTRRCRIAPLRSEGNPTPVLIPTLLPEIVIYGIPAPV